MAEGTVVHIGENSPEYVAYRLMEAIAMAEKKTLPGRGGSQDPDRAWLLRTYAQCVQVVKEPHMVEDHLAPLTD